MAGLLRANFFRMWKTTAFWGCIIFPVALGLLMQMLEGSGRGFFRSMYNASPLSLFFSVVFAVRYIGTDNSDKTVRNKLIIGISRVKIYFANLITVSVGMVLIFAGSWLALIIYDLVSGGYLDMEPWLLVLYAVLCLIAGAAMMAVCTLLAALVTSRSLATAITIAITIGMFYATLHLSDFSTSLTAKIIFNSLPTIQIQDIQSRVSYMNNHPEIGILYVLKPMWYSLGAGAAATISGVLAFRRKNLK